MGWATLVLAVSQPVGRGASNHSSATGDVMKSSTKDKAEGKLKETKGKLKEVAGKLTDNPELEGEGKAEKIAGKVQGKVGEIKKVLGD